MSGNIVNVTTRISVRDGFNFAYGIMLCIASYLLLVAACDLLFPSPFDSSDNPPFRSGLRIKTDNLTGCQYLVSLWSITPRVDATGKQVCK